MIFKYFFLFVFLLYPLNSYSTNINVLDMNFLMQNSSSLKQLYLQIENDQKVYLLKFKDEESLLEQKLLEINQLKLILSKEELDIEINNYNVLLDKLNFKVKDFNLHYEKQINNQKNKIINIILEILKKYSVENQIDLILDANNYILSNNSINITDLILNNLNNITIETNFEKYK